MKTILKLEELLMFVASAYAMYLLHAAWWFYLLLLLGPDISMLGYLAGKKVGAVAYNLFHHKGIALIVLVAGLLTHQINLQIIGLVLFGHSSMDRFFGYGLKYDEGFQFTHLGKIGNKKIV